MAVAVHGLRKTYAAPDGAAQPVIDIAAFALADGEQAALVGASGSGKSTLLHLLAGIVAADGGRIELTGPGGTVDLAALGEAARDRLRGERIGCIFQSHHLLPAMTALENVLLGMSFSGRRADPAWAKALLGEVGLGQRLHHRPDQLSLGQQQRVACARALANRPQVLLADEPTGALDAATAQEVITLIQRLTAQVGASALVVTHDPAIAARFPRVVSLGELNRAAAP